MRQASRPGESAEGRGQRTQWKPTASAATHPGAAQVLTPKSQEGDLDAVQRTAGTNQTPGAHLQLSATSASHNGLAGEDSVAAFPPSKISRKLLFGSVPTWNQ